MEVRYWIEWSAVGPSAAFNATKAASQLPSVAPLAFPLTPIAFERTTFPEHPPLARHGRADTVTSFRLQLQPLPMVILEFRSLTPWIRQSTLLLPRSMIRTRRATSHPEVPMLSARRLEWTDIYEWELISV